jgi:eukaryotic-like serine/threonine-protein kinase
VTTGASGVPLVTVLDFGISKSSVLEHLWPEMSTPIGTPIYMSPEHFTAPRRVDARSDVWSLGVILFEMLAGLPPFLGNTLPQIRVRVLRGLYPRLSAMRGD